jgi:endonuclease/exonuclease/phosphatase family metal-dependent hydrolase
LQLPNLTKIPVNAFLTKISDMRFVCILPVLTRCKSSAGACRQGIHECSRSGGAPVLLVFSFLVVATASSSHARMQMVAPASSGTGDQCQYRVATFNVSLNRKNAGDLESELAGGNSAQARAIAEVIQRVRPDVILLNEFDYSDSPAGPRLFQEQYLAVPWNGQQPIVYPFSFSGPVNTGVPSAMDLNRNGATSDPEDALGYGTFPGQYGMLVLSRYPIAADSIRTFRKFPWHRMPGALRPVDPVTGESWFDDATWARLPVSSKSHWDLPLRLNGKTVHLLCSHPVPPVFDGPEDRNGCRNHDEIRFWADYIGNRADYHFDDFGRSGGLPEGSLFVIVGDLNADPNDGDNRDNSIRQLLDHPHIDSTVVPASRGSVEATQRDGLVNQSHRGESSFDTADFGDEFSGNLRVDYCLPSKGLRPVGGGVFWPASDEDGHSLNSASDHHLIWIDLVFEAR